MKKVNYLLIASFLYLSAGCKGQQSIKDKLAELKELMAAGEYPNIDAIILASNHETLVEEYYYSKLRMVYNTKWPRLCSGFLSDETNRYVENCSIDFE